MSEPGRPEVEFDVIVRSHNGFDNQLAGEALQDLYDIAVNSMDFGSGFLSTEEVNHLRDVGRAIGAEPLHYKDTPDEQSCDGGDWVAPPIYADGVLIRDAGGHGPNPCTCGAMEGSY